MTDPRSIDPSIGDDYVDHYFHSDDDQVPENSVLTENKLLPKKSNLSREINNFPQFLRRFGSQSIYILVYGAQLQKLYSVLNSQNKWVSGALHKKSN